MEAFAKQRKVRFPKSQVNLKSKVVTDKGNIKFEEKLSSIDQTNDKSKIVEIVEILATIETFEKNNGSEISLIKTLRTESVRSKGRQTKKSRRSVSHDPSKKKNKDTGKVNTLDDYFGLRKSERQISKESKTEKSRYIEESIINEVEVGLSVQHFGIKGFGVVAAKNFHKDDFIVEYAGDLISQKEAVERDQKYKEDPNIGCYMYHFIYQGRRFCIDATEDRGRLGRLLNHSRLKPNCYTKIVPIDGTPRLVIFAKRDIEPDEELLYDYGERDKDVIEAHPWLKT